MSSIIKRSIINALLTTIYIIIIASFLYYAQSFHLIENTLLIPIVMLMLFVFSAAFTGMLIFGKPVMLYLDNKKKEAFLLLAYTLGIFLLITILIFILLLIFSI